MNDVMTSVGGREPGQIGRCLAQDLVGLPELPVLALERLEARTLVSGEAGTPAGVALGLADLLAKRVRRAAELAGARLDGGPLRGILSSVCAYSA